MRIIIVYDTSEHADAAIYVNSILRETKEMASVDILDIGNIKYPFEKIALIRRESKGCDFIITVDLAGFCAKTEMDSISYNTFHIPIAHFVYDINMAESNELYNRLTFSQFVYVSKSIDIIAYRESHKNIENIKYIPEEIKKWLEDFVYEVFIL